MYITQSSFLGKTTPVDPTRTIPEFPKPADANYPNRWMEDRNLRSLHSKVNPLSFSTGKKRRDLSMDNQNRPDFLNV